MELDLKDRVRIVAGIVMTLAIAVIASSMVLNGASRDFNGSPISILTVLRDFELRTDAETIAAAIFVGVVALCIVFIGVMIYTTTTTRYGTAHFQSVKELRRNGFMTAGWVSDYTGAAALLGSLPEWLLADRTMTLTVSEILLNTGG